MTKMTFKLWMEGEGAGTGGGVDGNGSGTGGAGTGAGLLGGGGAGGGGAGAFELPADYDFRSLLPEDVRSDPSLEKFKNSKGKDFFEQIVRSNIGAQKLIGSDPNSLVKMPAADKITPEFRREMFGKMGLPDAAKTPEAYALKAPKEGVVKGFEPDQPLAKWLSKAAAEQGIFPDQAQALYEGFIKESGEWNKTTTAAQHAEDTSNISALQKEFGPAFDGEVAKAKFAVEKLGGKELTAKLNAAGLGTDPVLFKALSKIGDMLAEGDGGDKGQFNTGEAPAAVMSRFDEKMQESLALIGTNPAQARKIAADAQKILSDYYDKK